MKNTAKRLLSLLLVFCVLTSCIVFVPAMTVSAATSGTTQSDTVTDVLINTDFSGGEKLVGSPVSGAADYTSNSSGYLTFSSSASTNAYLSLNVGSYAPKTGSVVIQFDFMLSGVSYTDAVLAKVDDNQLLHAQRTGSRYIVPFSGSAYFSSSGRQAVSTGTWYTAAFEIVFTGSRNSYTANAYYGSQGGTLSSFGDSITVSSALTEFRICMGTNEWSLDNLIIYTTTATSGAKDLTVSSTDKGYLYNENVWGFDVGDMSSTSHPYLFANQSKFDELKNAYDSQSDEELYDYIAYQITRADSIYASYATLTSNVCTGVNTSKTALPKDYYSNKGYDVGGRLGDAATHTENIQLLAFAYQITREDKYALLAYYYAIQMGTWEHWGPGHFLNAADAMAPYAIAYDWLYNAWGELGLDVTAVESILFTHGLLPAYYSAANGGNPTGWYSSGAGNGGANYANRTNNWNTVCNSGVTVASLALVGCTTSAGGTTIDNTVDGTYSATTAYNSSNLLRDWNGSTLSSTTVITDGTYQDYAQYLVNVALSSVPALGLGQYVPDGSYIESNGYWGYGTNNLYEMIAALVSTTGSDWGLLSQPGIESTAYFALNTQSGAGQSWNYHDSDSTGPADTCWFQWLGGANIYGQTDLAGIRKDFLEKTSLRPSVWDAIYYMSDSQIGNFEYPELQYYAEGVDGYVVRDGWDVDSSYAAFMGNTNNVAHGQIDSGAFIYYNNGVKWFGDLGTENYNAYEFWGDSSEDDDTYGRYHYYKMGGEGNNDLIITSDSSSLPYGQDVDGFGYLTSQGNNSYGAYAILDNTSVYGSYASGALRGMLMTNDRRTVVIQDQASFTSAVDVAWIAHTQQRISLSLDGTVAYLTNGDSAIKVTLIDKDGAGLKFEILGVGGSNKLLDVTVADDYSVNNGGVAQDDDLDGWQRLVIRKSGVTSFNVAVVIEEVPFGEDAAAFGSAYEWVDMSSWVPAADDRYESDGSGDEGETPDEGETEEAPDVIATVKVGTYANAPEDAEDDTPVVDIFAGSTGSADSSDWGEITYTTYDVATFAELADTVNAQPSTAVITVELKWSSSIPVALNNRCTVNLNGYSLAAISNTYITSVDGDVLTVDDGEITVSWHVGGETVTQTYTSSCIATYPGSLSTALQERYNGDNTYSYFTYAWSTSEGGSAASTNEMIVTASNRDFYAVEKPYNGYYVTVKDGVITGYADATAPAKFFQSILGGSYDRICITKDFEYNSTGISDSAGRSSMNIYFNGNTITYDSEDSSDHMITLTSGTLNMYGPGGVLNNAPNSNILMQNGVSTVKADGVTFNTNHAVTDQRAGESYFYDCDIYMQANESAFGVINRNNVMSGDDMPYLVVSGCHISMPYSSGGNVVFSIRSNAKLEVCDGTVIEVGSGTYLFGLINSPVIGTAGWEYELTASANWKNYDYDAYANMWAMLGEVYHNCERGLVTAQTDLGDHATKTADDGTVYTQDYWTNNGLADLSEDELAEYEAEMLAKMAKHIVYTNGAKFAEGELTDEIIESHIADGLVVARQNSSVYPYVVAKEDAVATVQWNSGTAETWLAGELPEAPATENKQFYTGITVVEAGKTYNFALAASTASFTVSMNMSLQSNFNVNFYIPTSASGIESFIVNGTPIALADAIIYNNGTTDYYKLSVTDIAPALSSGNFTLVVVFENGETFTIAYSIAKYAQKVLTNESSSEEAKKMMVNLLKYMEYAHVYAGKNNSAAYEEIGDVLNDYSAYAGVAIVDRANADTSAVSDAIESAQLYLESAMNFRFNLAEGYTGKITFKCGTKEIVTIDVVDGKHGEELDYVDISRKAYDMITGITIVTDNGEATYTLANYYTATATAQGNLTSLLNALYAYCECALAYQNSL